MKWTDKMVVISAGDFTRLLNGKTIDKDTRYIIKETGDIFYGRDRIGIIQSSSAEDKDTVDFNKGPAVIKSGDSLWNFPEGFQAYGKDRQMLIWANDEWNEVKKKMSYDKFEMTREEKENAEAAIMEMISTTNDTLRELMDYLATLEVDRGKEKRDNKKLFDRVDAIEGWINEREHNHGINTSRTANHSGDIAKLKADVAALQSQMSMLKRSLRETASALNSIY